MRLAQVSAGLGYMRERELAKYRYRITWIDGTPHLQRCPIWAEFSTRPSFERRVPGIYDQHGEIVGPATAEDMAAMYDGRLPFDSETEPGRKAWRKHVEAGGD